MPKNSSGEHIEGSAAFYTNKQSEIIETTNASTFPVGQTIVFNDTITSLGFGESVSDIFSFNLQ